MPIGLSTVGLSVHFGGVRALRDVTLAVEPGQILGLIGPNGAGKTTLVNVLSGFQDPTTGYIALDGRSIERWRPHRRARAGVARTFQGVRAFERLSVRENVEIGALAVGQRPSAARSLADRLLQALSLAELADRQAGTLPFGLKRRLGVARAMANGPRYLLLDEPGAGLNEPEADELGDALRQLPIAFGCGLLVIDHHMPLVFGLCQAVHVLHHGATIAVGTPADIQADKAVIDAYLTNTTRPDDDAATSAAAPPRRRVG